MTAPRPMARARGGSPSGPLPGPGAGRVAAPLSRQGLRERLEGAPLPGGAGDLPQQGVAMAALTAGLGGERRLEASREAPSLEAQHHGGEHHGLRSPGRAPPPPPPAPRRGPAPA